MSAREGHRLSRAAAYLALLAASTLLVCALVPRARALSPTSLDPGGQSVSAYGGWAAWSRYDAATKQFSLVLRSPTGMLLLPPVPERPTQFDVELGPTEAGITAVYSRCANRTTLAGCHLYELKLGETQAGEHVLAIPGGGSLHEPAIWQGRVAFLRRNPAGGSEDAAHPTARRPDVLFVWKRGSATLQRVPLPASKGERRAGWPRGLTGIISGLTLNGGALAYTTATGIKTSGFELSMFTLWYQRLGQGSRLIDQITAGQANVCMPSLLSPTIVGKKLYAYLHLCDPSAANLDRWMRYDVQTRSAQRARFQFVSSSESSITSIVPDGDGAYWDSEDSIQKLDHVTWTGIGRPKPQSFCTHNDLFC